MNRYRDNYDIRRSTGKSNISSFYFASESILFSSTDQIYPPPPPPPQVEGPDGKMVIPFERERRVRLIDEILVSANLSGELAASRFAGEK